MQTSNSLLKEKINTRVISFPSWELFSKQSKNYKNIIIGNKPIFAIEAGVINGWEKYVPSENFLGISTFGASGPYNKLYEHFGLTCTDLSNLIKNKL